MTNYETRLISTNVLASFSATSGIIFPMVDWCYDLNKGGNNWFALDLYGSSADTSDDARAIFFDFYPCFYLHTLVQEIAKQKGIKITGSVLDNQLYKSIVIAPRSGEMKRENIKITTAYGTSQSNTGGDIQYTSFTAASNPEGLFASNQYTAARNSRIIITLTITEQGGDDNGWWTLLQNASTVNTIPVNQAVTSVDRTWIMAAIAAPGDVFTLYFRRDGGMGSTISFAFNIKFDVPTTITTLDYFLPNYFLPELSCLAIVKFVINYFGCSVHYDEYSKTLSINQVERFKLEDAEDWSDYIQPETIQHNYTIEAAANNYMRLSESDDYEVKAYNRQNVVKYGEGNITTVNTLKDQADIMQIPFAASEFGLSKNGDWLSNIPLVTLSDGQVIEYSAIGNSAGRAQYTYAFDVQFVAGQAVRIVDATKGDIGTYVVSSSTTTTVIFAGLSYPGATSTGKLYPQSIAFNEIKPRILAVKPSTALSNFGTDSEFSLYGTGGLGSPSGETTTAFAAFSRPTTGLSIDNWKANLALDNPNIELFTLPSVKELCFGKISSMIGNPTHKAMFVLPESVFQAYGFQSFIYLKTEKLTGYFLVYAISNYRDSNTEVEVTLYML